MVGNPSSLFIGKSKPEFDISVMCCLQFPAFKEKLSDSQLASLARDFSMLLSHCPLQSLVLSPVWSSCGHGNGVLPFYD